MICIFRHYFNVDEVSWITLAHSQKIITECDGIITNCASLVYYKVRWTAITNCDSFFITKCDTVYYKSRQVLQSAMGGVEGSGWTGHPELFTRLPFSMHKTIKGLWGCSKFFAELIKLWFNEYLHQTKYFIVYAVTAAHILLTKFTSVILY